MRFSLLAVAFLLAACQTGTGVGGYGEPMTTRSHSLALASEPSCQGFPGGIEGSWCMLEMMWQGSGRADPCQGMTGRDGHNCRVSEIEAYNDPVNNPLEGDFTS